jgi:hypothetical protein
MKIQQKEHTDIVAFRRKNHSLAPHSCPLCKKKTQEVCTPNNIKKIKRRTLSKFIVNFAVQNDKFSIKDEYIRTK